MTGEGAGPTQAVEMLSPEQLQAVIEARRRARAEREGMMSLTRQEYIQGSVPFQRVARDLFEDMESAREKTRLAARGKKKGRRARREAARANEEAVKDRYREAMSARSQRKYDLDRQRQSLRAAQAANAERKAAWEARQNDQARAVDAEQARKAARLAKWMAYEKAAGRGQAAGESEQEAGGSGTVEMLSPEQLQAVIEARRRARAEREGMMTWQD